MASPQIDDGYVRIARELGEAFCKLNLGSSEWVVLLVILMKTYGWQKKEDKISLTQFEALSLMSRPRIIRSLSKLVSYGVVGKKNGNPRVSSTYWIIKDYDLWKSPKNDSVKSNNTMFSGNTAITTFSGNTAITAAVRSTQERGGNTAITHKRIQQKNTKRCEASASPVDIPPVIKNHPKRDPAHRAIDFFLEKYTELTAKKYVITNWAKQTVNMKRIIANVGPEEYRQSLDKYFESDLAEKKGYSLDFFIASINSWRPSSHE